MFQTLLLFLLLMHIEKVLIKNFSQFNALLNIFKMIWIHHSW